ncbi:hypothetical protein PENSPDRAFT_690298 [Peniophora sp. CONT]|nr:hypothetical protein PENSPDRAFT_690298 [Peniophora sp. CONT]
MKKGSMPELEEGPLPLVVASHDVPHAGAAVADGQVSTPSENDHGSCGRRWPEEEGPLFWDVTAYMLDERWFVLVLWPGNEYAPYIDDDLGWNASHSYGREYAIQALFGSPSPSVSPSGNHAPHSPPTLRVDTDAARDAVCCLPGVTLDNFVHIIRSLLPDVDTVPLHRFFFPGAPGWMSVSAVANMRLVCKSWNAAISHEMAWISAALLPAARHVPGWRSCIKAAGKCDVRLVYGPYVPIDLVDEQVTRATAVYAGEGCPRRDFGRFLSGLALPRLEVLVIRPGTSLASYLIAMPTYERPLEAYKLRVYESSCPLALVAPNVQRAALYLHTWDQLVRALDPLTSLRRLVVEDIIGSCSADFTELLRHTPFHSLRFIRLQCTQSQAAASQNTGSPLHCPALIDMDVSGPVSVHAENLETCKLLDVTVGDVLPVLEAAPGLFALHLRLAQHHIASSIPSTAQPLTQPLTQPLEQVSLDLSRLETLHLAGEMASHTLEFFRSITAYGLAEAQVFCSMPPSPSYVDLAWLNKRLIRAIKLNPPHAPGHLTSILREVRDTLRDDGHLELARKLRDIPSHPHTWVEGPPPEMALAELIALARSLSSAIDDTIIRGPPPHSGHLLSEVVDAALIAVGVGDPVSAKSQLSIWEVGSLVHYLLTTRKGECQLTFTMEKNGIGEWLDDHRRTILDNTIFGAARMLFGLTVAQPRSLVVRGDPFEGIVPPAGSPDVRMMSDMLRLYSSVNSLRLEYEDLNLTFGCTLLSAMEDPLALPNLARIVVKCAPDRDRPLGHYEDGRYVGPDNDSPGTVLNAVLDMLMYRGKAGASPLVLEIHGGFCLSQPDGDRASALARQLEVFALCVRPGGHHSCEVCSWIH